jgi:hypothetical protein
MNVKNGLNITVDKVISTLKAISDLAKKDVLVGVPDGNPERDDGPISNAAIGYLQETGSPANNIPARPHLVPGIAGEQDKIAERLGKAGSEALGGNSAAADRNLHAAGMLGQNAVRAKISDGPFQQLADSTLAARRARGRTGEKPLLDTGQYRNAITYVIRNKQ